MKNDNIDYIFGSVFEKGVNYSYDTDDCDILNIFQSEMNLIGKKKKNY